MSLMVGSDPELFLRDANGELVNAQDIIPGSKWNPCKTEHGSIQPDNILAEFNSRPSKNAEEFVANHNLILNDLKAVLAPLDLQLDFIASAIASAELLSDPRTLIAGCEPDYNVWLCKPLKRKARLVTNPGVDYYSTYVRAAGGHLHISFDQAENDKNFEKRFMFVKALDYNLGVPSVIHDGDQQRRKYYGRAGAFRPKVSKYDAYDGVEYRTLSNFWVKSNELMEWVYGKVEEVYNNLEELSDKAQYYSSSIQEIINTGNQEKARVFCENEGLVW